MSYDFDQPIDRTESDSAKWRYYDKDVLPMWVADMDFLSPEPVRQALRERVEHGVFGYGLLPNELREVVVERLQRLYGWQVAPEALMFLPGVVAGFNLACRASAAPGGDVLMQPPIYHPMLAAPENAGLACNEAELVQGSDGRYEIDLQAFEAAIRPGTRTFLLCNPHNPVGRVFTRRELEGLAEVCLRHELVICSDEIHCDFVYPGHQHVPIGALGSEVAERTITLIAPSKTFNIAGLHCAVAIIPNPELRERLGVAGAGLTTHKFGPEWAGRVDLLSFTAALAAYRDGQPWLDALMLYLEGNRDFLLEYVRKQLPGIQAYRPEGTYLAWLDCRALELPGGPAAFFHERARVALSDGALFGRAGEGFVRLNFGCRRAMLEEALERMRAAVAVGVVSSQ